MIDIHAPEWKRAIEAANSVNIADYCEMTGVAVVRQGSEWRHGEYDSLKMRDNKWKRWSGKTEKLGKYIQGTTITFVMEYEGLRFFDAIERLLRSSGQEYLMPRREGAAQSACAAGSGVPIQEIVRQSIEKPEQKAEQETIVMTPPGRNENNEGVFRYLTKTRGIDAGIVIGQLKLKLLYESEEHHNCVFIGLNDEGVPAYAWLRSSNPNVPFKRDAKNSRKKWSWSYAPTAGSRALKVFESPIDALSYITLEKRKGEDWQHAHYLSLGGVSNDALDACLARNDQIREIIFCLDNDEAGRNAANRLMAGYSGRFECGAQFPPGGAKDWNEALTGREKAEKQQRKQAEGPMERKAMDMEEQNCEK